VHRIELDNPSKVLFRAWEVAVVLEEASEKPVGAGVVRIELDRPSKALFRAWEVTLVLEDARESPVGAGILRIELAMLRAFDVSLAAES